jgi:hypothetical protein
MVGVLRPFIAVETLCLSMRLAAFIRPVLTEKVEVVTEILPALRNIFLEGHPSFPESFHLRAVRRWTPGLG